MDSQLLGWLGSVCGVLLAVAVNLRLLRLNLRLILDCLVAVKAISRELLPSRHKSALTCKRLPKTKTQRGQGPARLPRRKV